MTKRILGYLALATAIAVVSVAGSPDPVTGWVQKAFFCQSNNCDSNPDTYGVLMLRWDTLSHSVQDQSAAGSGGFPVSASTAVGGQGLEIIYGNGVPLDASVPSSTLFAPVRYRRSDGHTTPAIEPFFSGYIRQGDVQGPVVAYVIDANQTSGERCPTLSVSRQDIDLTDPTKGYSIVVPQSQSNVAVADPIRAALAAMNNWNSVQTLRSNSGGGSIGGLSNAAPRVPGFKFAQADIHPCDGNFAAQILAANQFDNNPFMTPNVTVIDADDLIVERYEFLGFDDYIVISDNTGPIYDIDDADVDNGFALNPIDGINQIIYDSSDGDIGEQLNLPSGVVMVVLPTVDRNGINNTLYRARGMAHGAIRDADILITGKGLSIASGFGGTMEGLLANALGHAIGLDHSPLYASENEFLQPAMFPFREEFPLSAPSLVRFLEADDEAAMLMMYPGEILNDLKSFATAGGAGVLNYNPGGGFDFNQIGVEPGDVVVNETTGNSTTVASVATPTSLNLSDGAFVFSAGDAFRVYGSLIGSVTAAGIKGTTTGIVSGAADGMIAGTAMVSISGTSDAAGSPTDLTDAGGLFVTNGVGAGALVVNYTGGFIATVTGAPASESQLTHTDVTPFAWAVNDVYRIIGNLAAGTASGNVLASASVDFSDGALGIAPGDAVLNATDGSVATVTSVTAYALGLSGLAGGSDNLFQFGDQYRVVGPGVLTTASSTDLWDAAKDFLSLGVVSGATITNLTDSATCTVTTVYRHRVVCDGLTGGNTFDPGDNYEITGAFAGEGSATVLRDSTATFLGYTDLAGQTGDTVINVTNGGTATVAAPVASNTQITTTALSGGNLWYGNQEYLVLDTVDSVAGTFGVPTGTVLVDLNKNFTRAGVQRGDAVFNLTDGSWSTITSVSANSLSLYGLAGGADNTFETGDQYEVTDGITGGTGAIAGCVRDSNGDPVFGASIVAVEIDGRNTSEDSLFQPLGERDVVGALSGAPVDPDGAVGRYCREYGAAANFADPVAETGSFCHDVFPLSIDPVEIDLDNPTRTSGIHEVVDPDPTTVFTGGTGCYLISGLPVNPQKGKAKYLVFAMDLDGSVGDIAQTVRSYLAKVSNRGYSKQANFDSGDLFSGSPNGVFERVDIVDLGSPDRVELPCDGITGVATGGDADTLIDTSRDFTTMGLVVGDTVEVVDADGTVGDGTIAAAGISATQIQLTANLSFGKTFGSEKYYRIARSRECPAAVPVADVNFRPGVISIEAGKVSRGINVTLPGARKLNPRFSDGTVFIGQNNRPSMTGTPQALVQPGQAYSFTPTVVDQDGDPLVFSIANKPTWAAFDTATGALTGSPTQADSGVTAGIIISVSDGNNSPVSLAPFSIRVNSPPSISGSPSLFVANGGSYSFVPSVTEPDSADIPLLVYAVSNLPPWAAFNSTTGEISGTAVPGSYANIIISVQDPYWPAVSLAGFTITVNSPPTISGTPSPTAGVGVSYSFVPTAVDGDAVFTGLATAGSNNTTLIDSLRDFGLIGIAAGAIVEKIVGGGPVGQATVVGVAGDTLTFGPLSNGASFGVGDSYRVTYPPVGDPLTFSVDALPSWASFNTVTGELSGTPGPGDAGEFKDIVISVTDNVYPAVSLPAFTISVNGAPTIGGSPITRAYPGVLYTFTPAASDPEADDLIFSVNSQLPPWAIFDPATGEISGTPAQVDAGVYPGIVITVSDGVNTPVVLPSFNITVNSLPVPVFPAGMPITSILAGTAPGGYVSTVSATDAEGDTITWSVNRVPSWASFNPVTGTITNTSMTTGGTTVNIIITVSDSTGPETVSLPPFTIIVNEAPVITAPVAPVGTVNAGSSYLFVPVVNDPDGIVSGIATGTDADTLADAAANFLANALITDGDTVENLSDLPTSTGVIDVGGIAATTIQLAANLSNGGSFDAGDVYRIRANPAESLVYSITNKPSWATFDVLTGALYGTPGESDAGQYDNIIISVTDNNFPPVSLTAFSIKVNGSPVLSGTPLPTARAGVSYTFTPTASDPNGDTLTFAITNKPPWADFDPATGTLSGTPIPDDGGTYSNIQIVATDSGSPALSSTPLTFSITVNTPPTLYLIDPVVASVAPGSAYSLVIRALDVDGDALTFQVEDVPAWAVLTPNAGNPIATGLYEATLSGTPLPANTGSYVLRISVSDGANPRVYLAPFTLIVNTAPAFAQPAVASVNAGNAYTSPAVTPFATDADGDPLEYSVQNLPVWASFNPTTGVITATGAATGANPGNYENISITVSDGNTGTATLTYTLRVEQAPSISGSPVLVAPPGVAYSFTPTVTDANGDSLTFSIANSPSWAVFNTATGTLSGTPSEADVGSYANVTISVTDGVFAPVSLAPFTITVNARPAFTIPVADVTVNAGSPLSFPSAPPLATDADPLTYSIQGQPSFTTFSPATGILAATGAATAANVGNYTGITISVSDGINAPVNYGPFALKVNGAPATSTPVSPAVAATALPGVAFSFTPSFSDPNGDALTLTISGCPEWAICDEVTGTVSGTPSLADYANSPWMVTYDVNDGSITPSFDFDIALNLPPVFDFASQGVVVMLPGDQISIDTSIDFSATDPDGDTLVWAITGQPAWTNFEPTTGAFDGSPTVAEIGNYSNIAVTVSDGFNPPVALGAFTIKVNGAPVTDTPVSPAVAATALAGVAFRFTPSFSDPNRDTLTLTISNCPEWALCDDVTGEISGTPSPADAANSPWTVTYDVDDGVATPSFDFDITLNLPPVFNVASPGVVRIEPGDTLSIDAPIDLSATDPDGDTLVWAITGQPAWTTFSPALGTLDGTAAGTDVGNYTNIAVTVTDGINPPVAYGVFTIKVNGPPVISGTPASPIAAGVAFTFTPTASDPNNDTLTYGIVGQPSWASFNPATGTLSGTPTASDALVVPPNTSITVDDGLVTDTLGPFQVFINRKPVFSVEATPAQINTGTAFLWPTALPTAVDPDGDTLSYSWSGTPVPWLALDAVTGQLSGTPAPADAGNYVVSIAAADALDPLTVKTFAIKVNGAPVLSGSPAVLTAAGQAFQYTPAATDPNGDPMTFSFSSCPAWATCDTATGLISGTPLASDYGTYGPITITASDTGAPALTGNLVVTITVNTPPQIISLSPTIAPVGSPFTFVVQALDVDHDDGDVVTITGTRVPAFFGAGGLSGPATNPRTLTYTFTPVLADTGSYQLEFEASDGVNAPVTLGPITFVVNREPVFVETYETEVDLGFSYNSPSATPVATDADDDPLVYSVTNLPSWALFNPLTGVITGTPSASDVGFHRDIVVTVTDYNGAEVSYGPFDIAVDTQAVISGTPGTLAIPDQAYSFIPAVTDPIDTSFTFFITGQPAWATFNPLTGELSGTPTLADSGATYGPIDICVDDDIFDVIPQACLPSFSILVNGPPVFVQTATDVTIDPGDLYSFGAVPPVATDPDADTLQYSITGRPAWLTFVPSTGELTGTPAIGDIGNYTMQISVTDFITPVVFMAPFTIKVNGPPVITNTPGVVLAGVPFSFTPAISDPNNDTVVITSITGCPTWAVCNPVTGAITGTPTVADGAASPWNVDYDLSDGLATPTIPFVLTMNRPPVITEVNAGTYYINVGNSLNLSPSFTTPDGDTLVWAVTNQPSWTTFDTATGALTSPVTTVADIGSYQNITISVSDGFNSPVVFGPFTVQVNGGPSLVAGTPARAVPGQAFSFTVPFTDPNGDSVTFDFLGTCPPWATCNTTTGVISGTPSAAGAPPYPDYVVDVEATDPGGLTSAQESYDITVNVPPSFAAPSIDWSVAAATGNTVFHPANLATDGNTVPDTVFYSIQNQPQWTVFDTVTGELQGNPSLATPGLYSNIIIRAEDGYQITPQRAFFIQINGSPSISGTPATRAYPNQLYTFTPTASDPESDDLTFSLAVPANLPAWALFDPATGQISGTPSQLDAGISAALTIEVSDGVNPAVSLAPFTIDVNSLPIISNPPPTQVNVGSPYGGAGGYTPTIFDFDDTVFTWSILNAPPWMVINPATGNLSGTPGFGGSYQNVVLRVTDDGGANYVQFPAFTITVNAPPTITLPGTPPYTVNVGDAISIVPGGGDTDPVLYTVTNLPAWAQFDQTNGTISNKAGRPVASDVGTFSGIVISVSDNIFPAVSTPAFAIKVNGAPVLSAGTPPRAVPDVAYTFAITGTDPNGDALTYDFQGTCPAWAFCSTTAGTISGTPSNADAGLYSITVDASDATNPIPLVSNTLNFDIRVNTRPVFTPAGLSPDTSVLVGASYSYPSALPTATDLVDGDTLTYSISNRPSWASFNPTTGAITSGVLTAGDAGIYSGIQVSVSDGYQTVSIPAFSVTVTGAPVISGTPSGIATPGVAYSFTPTASSPVGNPIDFQITNKPAWALFSTTTGALTGTPVVADAVNSPYAGIVITVRDTITLQTSSLPPFAIVVNSPPVVSGVPPDYAAVGVAFSFTPSVSDPNPGDTITYSFDNCPSWAVCNVVTGSISGTPAGSDRGSYAGVRILVSDGVNPAVPLGPFTIIVNSPPVPSFVSPASPTVIHHPVSPLTAFSVTVSATDDDGETLTWSVQNLPAWAQFNQSTGEITNRPGRPTLADAGTYSNIIISVTDGNFAEQPLPAFSVVVNRPPVIAAKANETIGIAPYTFTPTVTDAEGDLLIYSLTTVHTWLGINVLTGELSGTPGPGDAGMQSVTVDVNDGINATVSMTYNLTVNARPSFATPCTDAVAPALVLYSCDPGGTDPEPGDLPLLVYSITGLPSWASFNASTGIISGTPGVTDDGVYSDIVISVKDPYNAAVSAPPFALTVTRPNLPPTIDGIPGTVANPGVLYSFTPVADDADDDDILTFSIVNKPPWAYFDTATGKLSGTPIRADRTNSPYTGIVISVSDGVNPDVSLPSFDIVVDTPPTISGAPQLFVAAATAYSFQPVAVDLDSPPTLEYSILNRPYWATFLPGADYPNFVSSGTTPALTGNPVSGDAGSYVGITIYVSDGINAPVALAPFTVIVNTPPIVTFNTDGGLNPRLPLYRVAVNGPVNELPQILYTKDDVDIFDSAIFVISELPDWIDLDPLADSVTPIFTAAPGRPVQSDAGVYTISVGVSDGNFNPIYDPDPIVIQVNGAPAISGIPATSVFSGQSYLFTPTVTNPETTDTLVFQVTNLPSWASFSTVTGQITGIPASGDVGTYSDITITVSDSVNDPVTMAPFSIQVNLGSTSGGGGSTTGDPNKKGGGCASGSADPSMAVWLAMVAAGAVGRFRRRRSE